MPALWAARSVSKLHPQLAAMDVPVPFSPVLEDLTVPTVERLVETAKTLIGKR